MKYALPTLLLLVFGHLSHAQKKSFQWVEETSFQTTVGKLAGYSIAVDAEEHTYVFGRNWVSFAENPAGYMVLARYDQNGAPDWYKTFEAISTTSAQMLMGGDGNLVVVTYQAGGVIDGDTLGGWLNGAATISPALACIKFDTLGNVIWKTRFQIDQNLSDDYQLILTPDDDLVIRGEGFVKWSADSLLTNDDKDFLVWMNGQNGDVISAKSAPYSPASFILGKRKIFPLSNGNILTVHRRKESFQPNWVIADEVDLTTNTIVSSDTIRLFPQMVLGMNRDFLDYQYDEDQHILYVFGEANDSGFEIENDTVFGTSGGSWTSPFVAKYDLTAKKVLASRVFTGYDSNPTPFQTTSYDGQDQITFVLQYRDSLTNNQLDSTYYPVPNSNGDSYNLLINNVDLDLNLNYWNYSVHNFAIQSCLDHYYSSAGNLFLLYTGGTDLFFDGMPFNADERHVIAKIGEAAGTIGIQSSEASDYGLQVYPNPASERVSLRADLPIEQVLIRDLQGRVVNVQPGGMGNELNLSSLPTGMYVIEVLFEDGQSSTRKLLKQ